MAKFDANGLAVVMLDPVRDKTRACTGGGGGVTPLTTACPEGPRG